MQGRAKRLVIILLGVLFLALTYICAGYACVAGVPFITERAAYVTIDPTNSVFDKLELVDGALATREYSFGNHNLDEYLNTIVEMNVEADTPYADYTVENIIDAPIQYSVDEEQINHLNDVFDVSSRMFYPILGLTVLAAFLLMIGLRYFGAYAPGRTLLWGGVLTIGIIAAFVVWAIMGFDSFFATFHSLFFADGSWTFPSDSLLITMLPQNFWIAIGVTWLVLSTIIACASIVLGSIMTKRNSKKN